MEIEQSAGRRAHYADFYDGPSSTDHVIVLGNCQAESLRIAMTGGGLSTVRVPPVHELTTGDRPHLERILADSRAVVTQPIRDGYRGLPVGTRQIADRLPRSVTLVVVPAIRHRSLHPMQAVVRIPDTVVDDPPIVAYHDLRLIAEESGTPLPPLTSDRVRRIASDSSATLRARELAADAVPVSDVFDRPRAELLRTINHPGNPVFVELALRVRERLGLTTEPDPVGRPLLSSVIAPIEEVVAGAWGGAATPDPFWTVEGERIHSDVVAEAHRRWYRQNPRALAQAAERHRDDLRLLQDA